MKRAHGLGIIFLLVLLALGGLSRGEEKGFLSARPGYSFRFPRDHGAHEAYRTEWWYYTGHLQAHSGESFGFQLTFFRRGLRPSEGREGASRWAVRNVYFAHFALSDIRQRTFHFSEKMSRGSLGDAGAEEGAYRVWIGDWRAEALDDTPDAPHRLRAKDDQYAIDLLLRPLRPPVLHGEQGLSRKGPGATQASHYYSLTRLEVKGTLRVGERTRSVSGQAWMDHEFGSSQLGPDQEGWDWFGLQLEGGYDLMLYLIRRKDGSIEPHSSGTLVFPDGRAFHLPREAFSVEVLERWKSPLSRAIYPIRWRLRVPSQGLVLEVKPHFPSQELDTRKSTRIVYWEGAVTVSGDQKGRPVKGQGYVEMTGYAGPFEKKL